MALQGPLTPTESENISSTGDECTKKESALPIKVVKKRLEMFLKVLAAVNSPRQLYLHQLLYAVYVVLLSKPEVSIAKLCLTCLLEYKHESIVPYKAALVNLTVEKEFRNELVALDVSASSEMIQHSHRRDLIPALVRLVYGRFSAKSDWKANRITR